jgi:hypothetical protein
MKVPTLCLGHLSANSVPVRVFALRRGCNLNPVYPYSLKAPGFNP